jgi:hypothetical protein
MVLGDLTELEVDGFNRVRGVHDQPQFRWVVQEWDELVPRPTLHVDRTGVLLAEVGVETGEGHFSCLQAGRGVDCPHAGRDLLAIGVRHEFMALRMTCTLCRYRHKAHLIRHVKGVPNCTPPSRNGPVRSSPCSARTPPRSPRPPLASATTSTPNYLLTCANATTKRSGGVSPPTGTATGRGQPPGMQPRHTPPRQSRCVTTDGAGLACPAREGRAGRIR